MSQDSSVIKVTYYTTEEWNSIHVKEKNFSSTQALGSTQPPIQRLLGDVSTKDKESDHEVDHATMSSVRF
jgi:hypothetical protein